MHQFEILVVGRCNGDLVLNSSKHSFKKGEGPHEGVDIRVQDSWVSIPTDAVPSDKTDKVTSRKDLGEFVGNLDYLFRWGGGGINSLSALADLRIASPNMGITFLTPSEPILHFGNRHENLVTYLAGKDLNHLFMNLSPINYNLVFGGENKTIVRNLPRERNISLRREHLGTIGIYLTPNDGVLINALNHPVITANIVQTVYMENQEFYASQETYRQISVTERAHRPEKFDLAKFRKVMTVITATPEIPREMLINDVFPYSGLIFNYEDLMKLFNPEKAGGPVNIEAAVQCISLLRHGIPTEHGVMRKMEDEFNNVYVTLGKHGHLVSNREKVYHVAPRPEIVHSVNAQIQQNKSSTSGAGDAFAAAVTYMETLGHDADIKRTAAVANTAVYKFLGIIRIVQPHEIEVLGEWDTKSNYQE